MASSKFFEDIRSATIERQVEDTYNKGICLYFPTDTGIEYPFGCDGFVDTKTGSGKILKLIIEYKFNEQLTNAVARARVLTQVIFYLKRFEQHGLILPNVCMVADKDECFVMHTNALLRYLDENLDWTISPSTAAEHNPDLVLQIAQDPDINPFIFIVDEHFSFQHVAEKIRNLADNIQRYVRVTEHNLARIFDYFCKHVLRGKTKQSGHDLVEIFMGIIGDKMNYYQHPANPNILVCHAKHIPIDGNAFNAFFSYFDRTYTPQETMRLNGIADRLIEDIDRRLKGDFWTPTIFVDYAHKMIENTLGSDWKERFIVWDNCWGTGNLTRDYHFDHLYCSTLFQSELNIGAAYNPEAVKFQFDFLNDPIPMPGDLVSEPTKMPPTLLEALQTNQPIVFFLNPPYATASQYGTDSKKDCAKSMVHEKMISEGIGACSQNLYAQFLYRIMKIKQTYHLTDCYIAVFCPTLFLAGQSFKLFREQLVDEFTFMDAFQFKASEFADVADSWGIGFTIFRTGKSADKETFRYGIAESDGVEIHITGYKTVYNADTATVSGKWVKENASKTIETITFTSALNVNEKGGKKQSANMLGTLVSDGNNVDKNMQHVSIFSAYAELGHNCVYEILPSNFTRCTAIFAARKLIEKNWINSKDEYLAPSENHPLYQDFVNDSIVYSLFHSASNQSSLRNIAYKGKTWNIVNEFFWLSAAEMTTLANEHHCAATYSEAHTASNRFVYTLLQSVSLSVEAKTVLEMASEIVRKTFKYRPLFDMEHPEYQIMNWDCGWYQVKALAKTYAKDDYAAFGEQFRHLADKMRPLVYELGFLK